MVLLAQLVAVALYLVPVAVLLVWRSSRARRPGEIALDVPLAVAVDLLAIMAASRLMRLEMAIALSRPLWLAAGVGRALFVRRNGGAWPEWPAAIGRRELAAIGSAGVVTTLMSLALTRPYVFGDRELHVATISAMRAQQIPFHTAYEPNATFHYHFAGDVFAAALQVLSFDVMHSSLAQSLAHTIVFALIAISVGLLMVEFGYRRTLSIWVGVLVAILAGPIVLRGRVHDVGEPYMGYSIYSFLAWGFRPSNQLAAVLLVGITGSLAMRLRPTEGRGTAAPLVATMALLGVTDEASTGLIGLALGLSWIFWPFALADTRRRGMAILALLAIGFLGTNLLFAASLAPGGPVQTLRLVPWQSPGVQYPPLALTTLFGWRALAGDVGPVVVPLIGLGMLVFGPKRDPARVALFAFLSVLTAISILMLTRVEANGAHMESHRFVIAIELVVPLAAILLVRQTSPGSLARYCIVGPIAFGCFSTTLWLSNYSSWLLTPQSAFYKNAKPFTETNCRDWAGASFGDRPHVTYVTEGFWYSYVGCRPAILAGRRREAWWTMKILPEFGGAALREIEQELSPSGGPIDIVCPAQADQADSDPVCVRALAHGEACTRQGDGFVRCRLPLHEASR
jgi:hypothetical protein